MLNSKSQLTSKATHRNINLDLDMGNLESDKLSVKDGLKNLRPKSTSCIRISRSDAKTTGVYQAHYKETSPLLIKSDLINGYLAIEIL